MEERRGKKGDVVTGEERNGCNTKSFIQCFDLNSSCTWFEHVSMLVILLNCVTLGMFQPCEDISCQSEWCRILQVLDDCIFAFFAVEMVIKMVALGIFGPNCYLGDKWNQLDFVIVMAGVMEYSLDGQNASLSAIRTVRVLRPLRAINRVPSMRILVTLLLDTLPMLGNVLLLCFFVFFIFGIVGVQLWAGLLRNRCFLDEGIKTQKLNYQIGQRQENRRIRSQRKDQSPNLAVGSEIIQEGKKNCFNVHNLRKPRLSLTHSLTNSDFDVMAQIVPEIFLLLCSSVIYCCRMSFSTVYLHAFAAHMNKSRLKVSNKQESDKQTLERMYNLSISSYYMSEEGEDNPFICSAGCENGMVCCHDVPRYTKDNKECTLSAPHQSLALIGSTPAMGGASVNSCVNWNQYYNICRPGDFNPHKGAVNFDNIGYAWIAIFQVGSFFMINLCLVVIATQFSETKQRENALMREQRARYMSNDSTLASYSEPGSCYEEMLRYISHLYRKFTRRLQRIYSGWQSKRHKKVNPNGSGGGSNGGGNGHGHGSSRGGGGLGPGSALWLRPIHNLLQHHQHQHCRLSNGGQHTTSAATTEHADREGVDGGVEELEMKALPVRRGSTNGNSSGGNPSVVTQNMGTLLGRLNGGMNYPTILPSFVCSYSSKTPPPHSQQSGRSPEQHSPNHPASEHTETLNKLYQLMGQHSRQRLLYQLAGVVPSPLLLELLSCPLCARSLETLELELGDLEGGRGEADGQHDFLQAGDLRGGRSWNRRRGVVEYKNRAFRAWEGFRKKLKWIVKSQYFERGIMIAILINTLSMGIEYHEQPEELTDVLEISNIVFTSMFVLEMGFMLLAFGLFGYIRSSYNIFDSIIVIISILGMHLFGCKFGLETENGDTIPDRKNFDSLLWAIVTVFQILTQEDWNVVLYNGMASTSPWAALYFVALMTFGNYVLFNLLVAILVEGFQAEGDANRSESDDEKKSDNFEEDEKVEQLRDTELKMYSLMMTANGHVDPRGSMGPPIIMRTAATPMPTPKSSLGPESILGDELMYREGMPRYGDVGLGFSETRIGHVESRRGSSTSPDHLAYDQRSLSHSSPSRRSPLPPRGSGSSWGSRRSSWNSLGRAPSLKRRDTSGERESLLSGEGGEEEDNREDKVEAGGSNRLRQGSLELLQASTLCPSIIAEYGDCNGRTLSFDPNLNTDPKEGISPEDDLDDDLFKGKFYQCEGLDTKNIRNKTDCLQASYHWKRRKYNFDNLIQALMSLFVLSSKDGWVNIMYDGLDAVEVDQQPERNHNPWMLLYFISFLLIVSFFVLNMFVGVVVENFHKCRQDQEEEENRLREEKKLKMIEKKRRNANLYIKGIHYLDLFITFIICINVFTMSIEHNNQPQYLTEVLKYCNYVFTCVFVIEALLKLVAFGIRRFFKDSAQTPKDGQRDEVSAGYCHASAATECSPSNPCEGLSRHATFENFGMAFLTLFRVSTGDNWSGIMKDTLRECRQEDRQCLTYLPLVSPIYFVTFVLMAQFVLVNVVVAVLMKHLEESNKEAKEGAEMDAEIAMEIALERQRRLSSTSNNSSVGGTYVGPCPHSPGQEEEVQYSDQDPPSSRKMSVSRMHSLPNDSYMFRPVQPASAPYPLEEVDSSPQDQHSDEEVYHITSSAQHRWRDEEGGGQESRGKAGRSHSLSPYTSPHSLDYSTSSPPPPPLPPSSSRSTLSLLGAGLKDRDFWKDFSANTQGFLDKPSSLSAGYPDDQRRHSIEVCLQQADITGDNQHFIEEVQRSEKSAQAFPVRVQSVGGSHRKKKMSPPCISIHPPAEREHPQMSSPPKLADCSMMLRRRTPSYDLTPHTQSDIQDADTQIHSPMHRVLTPIHVQLQAHSPSHTLTPSRASTPTHAQTYTPPHASTPTQPHIPISPNIQPRAPLVPTTMPFSHTHSLSPAARHSSLTGDYITLPQFTFDQPQSRYLSDTDTATCSSPFDNRLGSSAGFSAKNRRTAQ
ncbi:hypothetical protein PAMP_009407 [Pampus punctatissimus]